MHAILVVGNYPPPYGGVPHHIERLTAYLAAQKIPCVALSGGVTGTKKKQNLTIIKPPYPRKLLGWARTRHTLLDDWLADGSFKREKPGEWRRYRMYIDVGRELVRRHDIRLIASYNLLSYAPIGAALAQEFGLPHVVSIFGEIYKHSEFVSRNKSFLAEVLGRASTVLSCSSHCADSARQVTALKTPVQALTYGIDLDHFKPGADGQALRNQLGIRQPKVLLFLARLGREMGLDVFMRAATKLMGERDDLHVLMVGQADDLLADAEAMASSHPGRVTVLVNHPYAGLPACYAAADVLAVPTRGLRTCSSLAAMEGMAVGVPVVAARMGGIPEIIEHGETGFLFAAEDAEALAGLTASILDSPLLAERLICQGRMRAQAEFSEQRVNVEMQALFDRLLAHS